MAEKLWTVSQVAPGDDQAEYIIVACVEANDTLYVIAANRITRPGPPRFVTVEVTVPSGAALAWRGQTGVGDQRGDLLVARFAVPPEGTPSLLVNVDSDGVGGLSLTVRPRPL